MADLVRAERPEKCSLVDINLADWALAQSTRDAYRRVARSFDDWRAGAGRGAGQVDGIRWEEADRMAELAECRGTGGLRGALLVRIMSDCLLRGAEAAALDVSDIDFRDGWVAVRGGAAQQDRPGGEPCSTPAPRRRGWRGGG